MGIKTFTLKNEKGLLFELKTPCKIFIAYTPFQSDEGIYPKLFEHVALWDTGASGSVISKKIVQNLNLKPTGKVRVRHAHGEEIVNTYMVNIYLPNRACMLLVEVSEANLDSFDILIGMDIITQGDFSISNFNNKTVFSFRYPSACDIDFLNDFDNRPVFHVTI